MERRTIIILIILGIIVGGYFLIRMIFPSTGAIPGIVDVGTGSESGETVFVDPYQPPTSEAKATFPSGNKFIISTPSGAIEVNNFFNNAEGYYPEMESLLIVRNQKFQLVFYRETGELSLTLMSGVLSEDISGIEENIINILGVGKSDLCKLQINYLQEFDGGYLEDLGTLPLCSSVLK